MKKLTPLQKAILEFDSQAAFARALGISDCYVSKMLRENHVPWKQAKKIESLTNGKVKASQLNPKVFKNAA